LDAGEDADKVTTPEKLISQAKATVFPLSRVKKIVNLNPDLALISPAAVFALEKAAELFLQDYTQTAMTVASKHNRKTIYLSDIKQTSNVPEFQFCKHSGLIKESDKN
jgi:histone H3/H4